MLILHCCCNRCLDDYRLRTNQSASVCAKEQIRYYQGRTECTRYRRLMNRYVLDVFTLIDLLSKCEDVFSILYEQMNKPITVIRSATHGGQQKHGIRVVISLR